MSSSPSPLDGRRVVVTRPEGPDGPLSRELAALGAEVLLWPAIEILPVEDSRPLAEALSALKDYDWLVITSARAVAPLLAAMPSDLPKPLRGPRVAAVGEASAAALRRAGIEVDRMPEMFSGEALVETFAAAEDAASARILLLVGDRARREVPEGLRALGAEVDEIVVYRTMASRLDVEACAREIRSRSISAVTFASPSAVEGVREALGDELLRDLLATAPVVVIGPTTAVALGALTLPPVSEIETVVAAPSTLRGLALAVTARLSSGTSP